MSIGVQSSFGNQLNVSLIFHLVEDLMNFFSFIIYFLQVAQLRQRFFNSIAPGGLAGDRRGVIPGSAFSFSAQQIWAVIRENKDLDLPAHKVILKF